MGWRGVSPPDLAGDLARAKELTDRGSPSLDQLALAILIESGRYDRHLRPGTGETAVIRAASSRSVRLYGMSGYRADGCPDPPQLVLGFGNTSRQATQAGISVLGSILNL